MGKEVGKRQLRRQVNKSVEQELRSVLVVEPAVRTVSVSEFNNHSIVTDVEINRNLSEESSQETGTGNLEDERALNWSPPRSVTALEDCGIDFNDHIEESDPAENDAEARREKFHSDLRAWAINQNITHSAVDKLLLILKPFFPNFPRCARTLLKTPRKSGVYNVDGGRQCYFGLREGLLKKLASGVNPKEGFKITCNFSIDGFSPYTNSTLCF